jgi:ankyrin repeat protein
VHFDGSREYPKIKVNAYSTGRITPINAAARNGHAEIVKMLLSWPFRAAAFIGVIRPVEYAFTLIFGCARSVATTAMLLDYGVDPNSRDPSKCTPLYQASTHGHIAVVATLREHQRIVTSSQFQHGRFVLRRLLELFGLWSMRSTQALREKVDRPLSIALS